MYPNMYCCAHAQYEPEIFPGLIYRMKVPKVVLLIFVSGKVVLTGEGRAVRGAMCSQVRQQGGGH